MNPDSRYSGRKDNTVHDCFTNLLVTFENSRINQRPIAIFFNDMNGCYDRLRMNLNNIATRRLGMDRNTSIAHAKSLTGMRHKLRTPYGNSNKSIGPNTRYGGSGQ